MRKGSGARACLLLAVSHWACTESATEGPGNPDGGGAAGLAGSAPAGAAGQTFEPCAPFAAPPSDPDAEAPALPVGLGASLYGLKSGRVIAIAADRMELETPEGTLALGWRGPALSPAFAVDDDVQIAGGTTGGLAGHAITIVRSATATAATVNGAAYRVLSTAPDASREFTGLGPDLPQLVYGLISCCSRGRINGRPLAVCDYSALEATFSGASTAIPLSTTSVVGAWSVTNVESSYSESQEYVWALQATLLGPATPRAADGGP